MDTAIKLSKEMKLVMRLAILTGQRRTEVAGCCASELQGLDGESPMWIIPGDTNRRGKITEGRTKNGREQRLPLSRQAADLFREAVRQCSDGAYVFPARLTVLAGTKTRTPHINGESVTMAMRRLRTAAGVDDVSVHDMRRAVSNWMKDQGVSREVRDLVLNHKDQSVTEEHYSATARMERQVRQALQSWADHVWSVIGLAASESNVVPMPTRAAAG